MPKDSGGIYGNPELVAHLMRQGQELNNLPDDLLKEAVGNPEAVSRLQNIKTPEPMVLTPNEPLELADMLTGFDAGRPFYVGLRTPTPDDFLKMTEGIKAAERGADEAQARRSADSMRPGAALDRLQISSPPILAGENGASLSIRVSPKKEGLDSAPEINIEGSFTQTDTLYGVWWPAEEWGSLVFRTFFNSLARVQLYTGLDRDEKHQLILSLVGRNYRQRAPLFWFPCPECGKYFMPKRRGQFYHNRDCAHKAGERRRYQEKKRLREGDSTR